MEKEFKRKNYAIKLSEPTIYVDNEKRRRSGHMTHALAEWEPNKLIDFNSNCSARTHDGHSPFGWIEYRLSEDGGETFSEIYELPYSKKELYDGVNVISVEKAVACEDGTIIAVCLRNDTVKGCEPWDTPMYVCSKDGGKTWSDEKELTPYPGRVYDACNHNGVIYILQLCNDGAIDFCGQNEEHVYRLYTSHNNGESFEELCVVPLPWEQRGYGSMVFDEEGRLHIYVYHQYDERNMDHIISEDCGKTWGEPQICYMAKGIRNPQVALMDGIYILHARAEECSGFVLYTSEDGSVWDEGEFIGEPKGLCYYSNNIVLKDKEGKNRLLIQYSETYKGSCVNVMHRWLRIEK